MANESIDIQKLAKLIVAYLNVWKLLKPERYRYYNNTPNPKKYHIYQNMIDFLEKNKIEDWYLYFYTQFMSLQFQIPRTIDKCYSEKSLEIYLNWRTRAMEHIGTTTLVKEGAKPDISKWVDVIPHIEEQKARLVKKGSELVCLGSKERYFGFHPKSQVCASCPVRATCAVQLYNMFQLQTNSDVDILAVRSGALSVETANAKLTTSGSGILL